MLHKSLAKISVDVHFLFFYSHMAKISCSYQLLYKQLSSGYSAHNTHIIHPVKLSQGSRMTMLLSEFSDLVSEFSDLASEFSDIPSEFSDLPSEFQKLTSK